MTSDEALWVARKHLESSAPGRVGMLLSDEAVHTVCEALVHACELVDAQDAMLKQAQAREDALRAQLDAVTQVATAALKALAETAWAHRDQAESRT